MQYLLRIAGRETGRIFSGKIYWFCMFFVPLFSCLFFLSLMHKGLPIALPIAITDMDNTSASRSLVRQLDLLEGLHVTATYNNFNEAQTEMQKGNIYGIFLIPRDFAQKTVSAKQPVLSFYTNNSYLIAGSLVFKDMKTAATLAAASVALQTGKARGYTDQQVMASIQPIVIEAHPIGNPWLNYSVYLNNVILPGILALMVMCTTVYSIGIEIKEKTVWEWLRNEQSSILPSLAGKLLPQTILFLLVGLLLYAVLYVVMQFPINGNIGSMLVALFLLITASQAMGVFMIGCLPTLRLGLSFACLFGMIAFSISGFSFPVNAMYPQIQAVSNVFPLRHYFLIYADQALNGRALFYSWPHYIALLGFGFLPVLTLRNLSWSLKYAPYKP
ncbi:MAG: ABC transporter permease [Candidatus Symbiothrix sp.]|jgi:ABC-2 type transport system permease protein|nr:ABC transporter permease [Candidatus Symbiothrix sp.]